MTSPEAPAQRQPGGIRQRLVVAAGVAGVVGVLGLAVGLLWRAVAPRVELRVVERGLEYVEAQPEQPVAADSWFALIGLATGVVFAVLAWVALRRYRGVAVLAGLVLGSLAGAWLAWWFPVWLEQRDFLAQASAADIGAHLYGPIALKITGLDHDLLWPPKATGVVVVQALGAAMAYTVLAGFSTDPQLRPAADRTYDLDDAEPYGEPYRDAEPYGTETVRSQGDPPPGISSGSGGPAGPPG